MMNARQISTLKKKIQFSSAPNSWCGHITPVEILHIIDYWGLYPNDCEWVVIDARERKASGVCSAIWFYFILHYEDKKRLNIKT